jgi:hypothetical protein
VLAFNRRFVWMSLDAPSVLIKDDELKCIIVI